MMVFCNNCLHIKKPHPGAMYSVARCLKTGGLVTSPVTGETTREDMSQCREKNRFFDCADFVFHRETLWEKIRRVF